MDAVIQQAEDLNGGDLVDDVAVSWSGRCRWRSRPMTDLAERRRRRRPGPAGRLRAPDRPAAWSLRRSLTVLAVVATS